MIHRLLAANHLTTNKETKMSKLLKSDTAQALLHMTAVLAVVVSAVLLVLLPTFI